MGNGLNKKGFTLFDEEFLVAVALQLDSYDFIDAADGVAKFLIEAFSFDVGTDDDVRVSSPSIKCLLIQRSGSLNALTSCSIVGSRVKLLSANGSSDQMQHPIIPFIPDHSPSPSLFIQNSLELFLRNVSSGIAGSPITDDDGWRFAHHGQLREIIFHVHLEAYQQALEFYSLLDAELGHQDHAACLNHQGWDFWDGEDSETFVGHLFLDLGEGCTLAAAWSTGYDYLIDRVSGLKPRKILFLILLQLDLVDLCLKLLDVVRGDGLALHCFFEQQFQLLFLLDFLEDEPHCYGQKDYQEKYDFYAGH